MLKIGDIELKSDLILPAIAGYSDIGLRKLAYRYGAGLCVTEMVSAKGLVYSSDGTAALLATDPSEPVKAVQLFGGDPEFIEKAVRLPVLDKFDIIDLNFGCPVPKIVKNGEGSALLTDVGRLSEVVSSAVHASEGRPVTAKIRLGFDAEHINAVEVAKAIERSGGKEVTVHGRTREMMYAGKADYGQIARVKDSVGIPVIGNGDVTDEASCEAMLRTGVDGVAIARGAIGKPWIFAELRGVRADVNIGSIVREHFESLLAILPERVAVNNIKSHVAAYTRGLRGGKEIKLKVFSATTKQDIYDVAHMFDDLN